MSENLPDLELNSLFKEVQNKKQNDFVSNFVADHLSNKNNSILMSNRDREFMSTYSESINSENSKKSITLSWTTKSASRDTDRFSSITNETSRDTDRLQLNNLDSTKVENTGGRPKRLVKQTILYQHSPHKFKKKV